MLSQLVLGLLVIITSAWLSLRLIGSVLYGVAGGCMGVVVLIGAVGMFAFKRPRDVHWHLTLMLDWLALILILYCTVVGHVPESDDCCSQQADVEYI